MLCSSSDVISCHGMRIECLLDPELVGSRWDLEGAYLLLRIIKIVLFID